MIALLLLVLALLPGCAPEASPAPLAPVAQAEPLYVPSDRAFAPGPDGVLHLGGADHDANILPFSTSTLLCKYTVVSGSLLSIGSNDVTESAPYTFASGDSVSFEVSFPVTGW